MQTGFSVQVFLPLWTRNGAQHRAPAIGTFTSALSVTRCGTEAGVLVGTAESLLDSPLGSVSWGLWQKPVSTSQ